jgi:hypothetical protein
LISARSRRKLGGATAITPFGSLAGSFPDLQRIMSGIVLQASPAAQPGTRRNSRYSFSFPSPEREGLTKTN